MCLNVTTIGLKGIVGICKFVIFADCVIRFVTLPCLHTHISLFMEWGGQIFWKIRQCCFITPLTPTRQMPSISSHWTPWFLSPIRYLQCSPPPPRKIAIYLICVNDLWGRGHFHKTVIPDQFETCMSSYLLWNHFN